jgi:hypothetical protein
MSTTAKLILTKNFSQLHLAKKRKCTKKYAVTVPQSGQPSANVSKAASNPFSKKRKLEETEAKA